MAEDFLKNLRQLKKVTQELAAKLDLEIIDWSISVAETEGEPDNARIIFKIKDPLNTSTVEEKEFNSLFNEIVGNIQKENDLGDIKNWLEE